MIKSFNKTNKFLEIESRILNLIQTYTDVFNNDSKTFARLLLGRKWYNLEDKILVYIERLLEEEVTESSRKHWK